MAQDTGSMSDAELDAMIANNPSEHDEIDSSGSENVSPLDDTEVGQTEENDSTTDVGQTDDLDEDLEGNLSSEEDDLDDLDDELDVDDESTEGTPDEDDEDDLDTDNESMVFQPLRASGKEYPIESMQELYSLASKGIDADKKWEESAEGRRMLSTMQKVGIDMDGFNVLVEASKGNQNAILSLLKKNNIDPLDLDADAFDGDYKPEDHSTGQFEIELDNVVAKIKNNPRYQESVDVVMNSWDEGSKQEFYGNPKILELLNIDMQKDSSGTSMYDRVSPVAEKMKALDTGTRKTDLEYYMAAGKKVIQAMKQSDESKTKAESSKQEKANSRKVTNSKKRKAAAPSGGRSPAVKSVDVTDLSDAELDALLEKTN